MYGSEIGGSMTLSAIAFKPMAGDASIFQQYTVYMGPTDLFSLGETFDANYSGEKTMVFSQSNITLSPSGDWVTLNLDTPYSFDGSGNLLVEIQYHGGMQSLYSGHWVHSDNRIVRANNHADPTGSALPFCPHLKLSGTFSLQTSTFGSIKASF